MIAERLVAAARVQDARRAFAAAAANAARMRRQPVRVVRVHVDLVAARGHLLAASLVEPVVALVTVQASEQQTTAALAEGERKECFPDELRHAGWKSKLNI